jgi:hypothetical protein
MFEYLRIDCPTIFKIKSCYRRFPLTRVITRSVPKIFIYKVPFFFSKLDYLMD